MVEEAKESVMNIYTRDRLICALLVLLICAPPAFAAVPGEAQSPEPSHLALGIRSGSLHQKEVLDQYFSDPPNEYRVVKYQLTDGALGPRGEF